MAYIINIDTSGPLASVCLAKDEVPLKTYINEHQKDHAAVIAGYIHQLMSDIDLSPADINAIAISGGPGSYTGLRVATATAKGLCYAWNIPLIAIGTLQMMANGAGQDVGNDHMLFCPMIDARRNEIFTAIYDHALQELMPPQAMILTEDSFQDWLKEYQVVFFGNGSNKFQQLAHLDAKFFISYIPNAEHLCSLSAKAWRQKQYADLAYFEPFYIKEFYQPLPKS